MKIKKDYYNLLKSILIKILKNKTKKIMIKFQRKELIIKLKPITMINMKEKKTNQRLLFLEVFNYHI